MGRATPATAFLERRGVAFAVHEYEHPAGDRRYGSVAAEQLGVEPARVFKTLFVALTGAAGAMAVGVVPVSGQLALKEIAAALGAKRAEMCEPRLAERTTGYVIGGISPFGQKNRHPVVVDTSAMNFASIFVSGGQRGLEIEIAPALVVELLRATLAPIAR